MEKIITRALFILGLSNKEIKFFLACFKIGPASINEVAKQAKLERSTAYLIAQDLVKEGFIKEDLKPYRKLIFTIEPRDLLRMVASKQRTLRRQELELEEKLPELQSLYQASEIRPKVKVFEGKQGLSAVFNDILSSKGEILLWTNQDTESNFFTPQDHDRFIEVRVKRQISIRVLAVNNPRGNRLTEKDLVAFRKTKLLPKDVDFSAETYIYDHKVAILDTKKDIIGVIIESEQITDAQKAIFELAWKINF